MCNLYNGQRIVILIFNPTRFCFWSIIFHMLCYVTKSCWIKNHVKRYFQHRECNAFIEDKFVENAFYSNILSKLLLIDSYTSMILFFSKRIAFTKKHYSWRNRRTGSNRKYKVYKAKWLTDDYLQRSYMYISMIKLHIIANLNLSIA